MSVIKMNIADGVTLNVIETDKFKTNYISVNFFVPLKAENAAKTAILPKVLKRGTMAHPTMEELSKRMDMLYSSRVLCRVAKFGEAQQLEFSASVLKNEYALDGTDILGETVRLMGEMIFEPIVNNSAFLSEYVESEKKNLTDDINALINNKNMYSVHRCTEIMCEGESFAIHELGTAEDVNAITPEGLYSYYREFIKTARAEIFFVGSTDTEALALELKKIFERVERAALPEIPTEVKRSAENVKRVTEDMAVSQGKLSIGFRTGKVLSDGDYHIFSLMAELYGGSPSSKLFMNVRERLSLCYYCRAIPNSRKGIMIVTSGIENENKEKAENEILAQLENVKSGDFTDEEIQAAKKSLINAYRELNDSPEALEQWYLGRAAANIDQTPEEMCEAVSAVTAEQISEAARGITLDTVYFMRGTLRGGEENEDDE